MPTLTQSDIAELEASAQHWDKIARESLEKEEWDVKVGIRLSVGGHAARSYRRAAESLRLQIATGEPHCSCCLKPLERCPVRPR